MTPKCLYIKTNGERCRGAATGQHGLCWAHAPENAEKRRRNASRGGKGKKSASIEINQIKADIRAVIAGVESGTIEGGSIIFQSYNVLLRAVEVLLIHVRTRPTIGTVDNLGLM